MQFGQEEEMVSANQVLLILDGTNRILKSEGPHSQCIVLLEAGVKVRMAGDCIEGCVRAGGANNSNEGGHNRRTA